MLRLKFILISEKAVNSILFGDWKDQQIVPSWKCRNPEDKT
jgi:hypothetical protein